MIPGPAPLAVAQGGGRDGGVTGGPAAVHAGS